MVAAIRLGPLTLGTIMVGIMVPPLPQRANASVVRTYNLGSNLQTDKQCRVSVHRQEVVGGATM